MTQAEKYREVAIEAVDKQITELEEKLVELRAAKQLLIESLGVTTSRKGRYSSDGPPKARLARGIPKKWVLEMLRLHGPLTVAQIISYVNSEKGRNMSDNTVRRVLDQLTNKGELAKMEDGRWTIYSPPRRNDKEDDLPF